MNQLLFLLECNQSRNISQNLNGEPPYRENVYDYYVLDDDRIAYRHVMHIYAFSEYNRSSAKVRKSKERIIKKLTQKYPDRTIIVLAMSTDENVPMEQRIQDALEAYKQTGAALRVIR